MAGYQGAPLALDTGQLLPLRFPIKTDLSGIIQGIQPLLLANLGTAGHQGAAQADGKSHRHHQGQGGPPVLDKEIAESSLSLLGRSAHGCGQPGLW